jgi:hypothetical protein
MMPEITELTADNTVKLPIEIASKFRPSDRFMIWTDGDIVYLKRVTPLPVTDIVEQTTQAPNETPLSLDEINDIIHQVRQESKDE